MSNMGNELSKPWQEKAWIQILALILGVLPLYSSLIIYELRRGEQFTLEQFIFYLAVIAPATIIIVWLLLRFLCGEGFRDLNRKPGKLYKDLITTLILSVLIIVANVVSYYILSQLLPEPASGTGIRNIFSGLSGNPGLLVLFAGPLIFLGAASEELVRVLMLSRLWKVWPSIVGKLIAVVISACLFGLIHLYRGPVHVGWTAIYGLLVALYYLRFGRVLPLILAHYLTNALQVVLAAVAR